MTSMTLDPPLTNPLPPDSELVAGVGMVICQNLSTPALGLACASAVGAWPGSALAPLLAAIDVAVAR